MVPRMIQCFRGSLQLEKMGSGSRIFFAIQGLKLHVLELIAVACVVSLSLCHLLRQEMAEAEQGNAGYEIGALSSGARLQTATTSWL